MSSLLFWGDNYRYACQRGCFGGITLEFRHNHHGCLIFSFLKGIWNKLCLWGKILLVPTTIKNAQNSWRKKTHRRMRQTQFLSSSEKSWANGRIRHDEGEHFLNNPPRPPCGKKQRFSLLFSKYEIQYMTPMVKNIQINRPGSYLFFVFSFSPSPSRSLSVYLSLSSLFIFLATFSHIFS